jgi:Short C-terminal domain/Putative heavy-metal-binding
MSMSQVSPMGDTSSSGSGIASNEPVCLACGTPTRGASSCGWCGKSLGYSRLPTRVVWEARQRNAELPPVQRPTNLRVEDIDIFVGEPGRDYRDLGPLKVRVTAATGFSKTPTVEDVNLKLRERAMRLSANAVINVTYSRGVSATSWKVLTARGTAVVLDNPPDPAPSDRPALTADPLERIHQLSDLLASGAITEDEYATAKRKLLDEV